MSSQENLAEMKTCSNGSTLLLVSADTEELEHGGVQRSLGMGRIPSSVSSLQSVSSTGEYVMESEAPPPGTALPVMESHIAACAGN